MTREVLDALDDAVSDLRLGLVRVKRFGTFAVVLVVAAAGGGRPSTVRRHGSHYRRSIAVS